jgi:alpha-ketoglutarate-dependent taurine dioxygenase
MTISVTSMDAPIGAEVHGIDLSQSLAQADVNAIKDVWRERLVPLHRDYDSLRGSG